MNKDINIVLNLIENRIYVVNQHDNNFKCDVEIYTDDNLLYKIPNDDVPAHGSRWHQPTRKFIEFNKIKVSLLKKINKDHDEDPFGEEDWDEDNEMILEKNWKLNLQIDEI